MNVSIILLSIMPPTNMGVWSHTCAQVRLHQFFTNSKVSNDSRCPYPSQQRHSNSANHISLQSVTFLSPILVNWVRAGCAMLQHPGICAATLDESTMRATRRRHTQFCEACFSLLRWSYVAGNHVFCCCGSQSVSLTASRHAMKVLVFVTCCHAVLSCAVCHVIKTHAVLSRAANTWSEALGLATQHACCPIRNLIDVTAHVEVSVTCCAGVTCCE